MQYFGEEPLSLRLSSGSGSDVITPKEHKKYLLQEILPGYSKDVHQIGDPYFALGGCRVDVYIG